MKGKLEVQGNKLFVKDENGNAMRVENVFKGYTGFYKTLEFCIDPSILVLGNEYEYERINDFECELK